MRVICLSRRCKGAEAVREGDLGDVLVLVMDGERDDVVDKGGLIIIRVRDGDVDEALRRVALRESLKASARFLGLAVGLAKKVEEALSDEVKLALRKDVLAALTDLGEARQLGAGEDLIKKKSNSSR